MTAPNHRRIRCFALAVITLMTGLLWRLAPLRLSAVVIKYGGSMLWAAMIYWLVAALKPRSRHLHIAVIAILIATAIEVFKLYHSPALDAFRLTLAGKLLLGRIFSYADIAAYTLAIALTAFIDDAFKPHIKPRDLH